MISHLCDRCGRALEAGELRYVAKLEIYAAADPLQVNAEDLQRDSRQEMDRLIEQCANLTEEELMRGVHVAFKFDLCPRCQKAVLTNPLAVA